MGTTKWSRSHHPGVPCPPCQKPIQGRRAAASRAHRAGDASYVPRATWQPASATVAARTSEAAHEAAEGNAPGKDCDLPAVMPPPAGAISRVGTRAAPTRRRRRPALRRSSSAGTSACGTEDALLAPGERSAAAQTSPSSPPESANSVWPLPPAHMATVCVALQAHDGEEPLEGPELPRRTPGV